MSPGAQIRSGTAFLEWAMVLALAASCYGLYRYEAGTIEHRIEDREVIRADVLANILRDELHSVATDLRILSDGDGLKAYLATGQPADLQRAITRAVFFSKLHPEYDQIRYLDESGKEVVRVNQGGRIVPPENLQDKSSRPFFQKTRGLGAGDVFISKFDLNVENGRIEQPIKPTLRFAVPIFDAAGVHRGIYIINYLGRTLIGRMQQSAPAVASRLRLLNARGFWLKAPDSKLEWGFDLPGRSDSTLAVSDPELWRHLDREAQGQVHRPRGLFTWVRVKPDEMMGPAGMRAFAEEDFLVTASEVTQAEFDSLLAGTRLTFAVISPALLVLAVSSIWFLRARRRALTDLRRSEEVMSVTLKSIGDAVLTTDVEGKVTFVNDMAEKLTGWKMAEAWGRPIADVFRIVQEKTREPAEIPVQSVLDSGQIAELAEDTVLISRNGTERAIADSAAPIRERGGEILGVVLVFRDVTTSRRAEKALRKSSEEIHDLYNRAPCGYHSLDAQGTIIAINETELRWIGRTATEVIGRVNFSELLTTESRVAFHSSFPAFREAGSVSGLELWMKRPDGGAFPVLVNATAVRDAAGNYLSSRSTVFDITKRKQAEMELDRFFSLSLDFLCISSADGFFKRVSPAVTDILGWTQQEFLTRPYLDFVHPEDLAATIREVERQVVSGEKVLQFDNRYRHKDGSWRTLSWRSVPQPDGLMYATARDVTERRRIEDEIRRLHADVERRAAQLEIANRELESFSYSVSHDLRAPLRHVQGYVELLTSELGTPLPGKAGHFLSTIAGSAREMDALIDNLLAFSRMARIEIGESVVDMNALVAETVEGLEAAINGRTIDWRIEKLPAVRGDRAMIKQVLANLLGNAVKYSRGRERAEITLARSGREGERYIFFVRDNGAGFDMKYADKLFGVFQRLHRVDEFEGTGIGLATVRRIIGRLGGRTWAEGKVGVGATIYFTLLPGVVLENGSS